MVARGVPAEPAAQKVNATIEAGILIRMRLPSDMRRWIPWVSLCVILVAFVIHWLPARQVRLHQEHLQKAVENRDWRKVGDFLDDDYRDQWGQTKTIALGHLHEAFRDFLAIGLVNEDFEIRRGDDALVVQSRMKIVGSGGPIAQWVMHEVEQLHEPFSYTWRRQSWMPWDWALVSVSQPEIEIPADVSSMEEF